MSSVDESYFYYEESIEIYNTIRKHMTASGSTPTYRLLVDDPGLSEKARDHLRDSQATITTVAEAQKAAKNLNGYRQARGLFNLAAHINDKMKASKVDIEGLLEESATSINITRSKKSTEDAFLHFGKNNNSNTIVKSLLFEDNSETVIPTGVPAFDDVSGGFSRGSLVTFGANSGGGKSTVANAVAIKMASMGYKVLLVPLEMSKKEMTARTMANVTKTNLTKILLQRLATGEREDVYQKYRKWVMRVKKKGGRYTIFKPQEDMTIEEVMAAISAYECDVVIIDYISLLKGADGDDQWRVLGSVARYAKINAEIENRVNILLCQVDDNAKIRYARAISEHSSNSWIWIATKETKESGLTRIEQPKSRNSLAFPFMIKLEYEFMRISDAPQDDALGSIDKKDDPAGKPKKKLKNLAQSDV
jgi:replicative DNA helicase